ncbi:Curli production assembly/transport component CsgG [Candidatus Magnetomorum sp. HK-1]|nr:Curli production assembly/transport component CsgG [Candidatus Magnetomorum sp. HK-1]
MIETIQSKNNVDNGLSVINIDMAREGNTVKTTIHENRCGELSSIQHYDTLEVPIKKIDSRCHEMVEMLNTTNRSGRVSKKALTRLREIGQIFYDELFTQTTKEKLRFSQAKYLQLTVDDQLVQIPWELLYDGNQFLCQRFCMGRSVKTRQSIPTNNNREVENPLKMLLIADPRGDLNGAYQEGIQLRNYMDRYKDQFHVTSFFDNVTTDAIKEKMRNYDMVHFAGHADYQDENISESGFRLTQKSLKASDIKKMAGAMPMPSLFFANACQSARTETWALDECFENNLYGLANAFLISGVKHYIGTFCEILDEPSRKFALVFYEKMRQGLPIGEAINKARWSLIEEFGEETIAWSSYILYGDPTIQYSEKSIPDEIPDEPIYHPFSNKTRTSSDDEEEVIMFDSKAPDKKRMGIYVFLTCFFMLATASIAALTFFGNPKETQVLRLISAEDQVHQTIVNEIKNKILIARNQERTDRIDKNIKSIEAKIPHTRKVVQIDSEFVPTMMIDIRSKDEESGKDNLISSVITEQFIQQGKIQVVERDDLDSVLEELNFGSSKLIDPSRRLTLGKILSANLLLSGWVQPSQTDVQVSMRVSEIETGKTIVAVNEVLDNRLPIFVQKKQLSERLLKRFEEIFSKSDIQ